MEQRQLPPAAGMDEPSAVLARTPESSPPILGLWLFAALLGNALAVALLLWSFLLAHPALRLRLGRAVRRVMGRPPTSSRQAPPSPSPAHPPSAMGACWKEAGMACAGACCAGCGVDVCAAREGQPPAPAPTLTRPPPRTFAHPASAAACPHADGSLATHPHLPQRAAHACTLLTAATPAAAAAAAAASSPPGAHGACWVSLQDAQVQMRRDPLFACPACTHACTLAAAAWNA